MKGELWCGVYSYSDMFLWICRASHNYGPDALDRPDKACMILAFMRHRHCSAESARQRSW